MKDEQPVTHQWANESALDRRERLLSKKNYREPIEEKLRILREAEYPTRRNHGDRGW